MTPRIALITILTDDVPTMVQFYRDTLGFGIQNDSGDYVEFVSEGVRFAVCARSELINATRDASYSAPRQGQSFELAFPCERAEDVDSSYATLVARGATPITAPATMPWGQRTAFFADPDGNIHELFADLPAQSS